MKGAPIQETHYDRVVWVSPIIEAIRREECLCWNCSKLTPGNRETNCHIANKLYVICVEEDVAIPVTRCPLFQLKEAT